MISSQDGQSSNQLLRDCVKYWSRKFVQNVQGDVQLISQGGLKKTEPVGHCGNTADQRRLTLEARIKAIRSKPTTTRSINRTLNRIEEDKTPER